ncbi:hypothetical protein WMY93_002631 [Mugilogobius chulae]|uniref:Lysosome-associated membrane glycoprotein 2-like luminal domain-containing protein n=1 Tax=Mugilogobius chulae TaxID=88201 RepID=A0AAW0Q2P3_9GOBI
MKLSPRGKEKESFRSPSGNEQLSESLHYRPVLQPHESVPPEGTYLLRTLTGSPCIKATLGAEFIVKDKKTWYFNLDPSRVHLTGNCGYKTAMLSLTLPDNAASLQFFFTKDKKVYYVRKITAHLSPIPLCKNCTQTFAGLVDHEKLFLTEGGLSFKCNSENLLHLSSVFRLKLVPLQIQAFSVPKDSSHKRWSAGPTITRGYTHHPRAVLVGLLLIALITYIIIKDRRKPSMRGCERNICQSETVMDQKKREDGFRRCEDRESPDRQQRRDRLSCDENG